MSIKIDFALGKKFYSSSVGFMNNFKNGKDVLTKSNEKIKKLISTKLKSMQSFFKILLVPFLLLFLPIEEEVEIKCLLEIMDYRGEGAYFVISVLDKEENYIKTVYVLGDDKSWFSELKYFWIHLRENNLFSDEDFYPLIDGISGPTISGGERRVFQIKVPKNLLNNSFHLRFETAVEDKAYYINDINIIDLMTEKDLLECDNLAVETLN